MDVNPRPSCSFENFDENASEYRKANETDPLDTSNFIPVTTIKINNSTFIPVTNIKAEEVFIKEESLEQGEEQNFGNEFEYTYDYNECGPSVIENTPQADRIPRDTSSFPRVLNPEIVTSPAGKKRKVIISIKDPSEMIDMSVVDSRDNIPERKIRPSQIRTHFEKYRSDLLSNQRPQTKFTQHSDDYYIFGQYIASGVRNIKDKRIRIKTQWKICNILHQARISNFK